ncbi:hypothetical protein AB0K49_09145, partial [Streptomyces decoyicus]
LKAVPGTATSAELDNADRNGSLIWEVDPIGADTALTPFCFLRHGVRGVMDGRAATPMPHPDFPRLHYIFYGVFTEPSRVARIGGLTLVGGAEKHRHRRRERAGGAAPLS